MKEVVSKKRMDIKNKDMIYYKDFVWFYNKIKIYLENGRWDE